MASLEMTENWRLLEGDVLAQLATLPQESVQCVVTSPPYWGLRDYKVAGQIGLEPTIEEWIEKMIAVFREIRRVLRLDGTVWLNLGDSYAGGTRGGATKPDDKQASNRGSLRGPVATPIGVKPKDLVGMPWLAAFALRTDGWWLRCDIIWSKPNPMPESVKDRPTRAHEYLFLLSKAERYYYDADAIREPLSEATKIRLSQPTFEQQMGGPKDSKTGNRSCRKTLENMHRRVPSGWKTGPGAHTDLTGRFKDKREAKYENANGKWRWNGSEFHTVPEGTMGANKRTVWEIATHPFPEAHFATFPEDLVRPCVLASCPPDGIVLDPFSGSGTTAIVALALGRRYIGIELNAKYNEMARKRLKATPFQMAMPI